MKKEDLKEDLKEIGNQAIQDLKPVVQKSSDNIFSFLKNIIDEALNNLFEKGNKNGNREEWIII